MKCVACAAALVVGLVQASGSAGPLVLVQTIDLPDVNGRIDHLAIDRSHHELYVAALENNTVEVLDLAKGVRARTLTGLHEPQGIAVLSDARGVAVANGETGDVVLFDSGNGSTGWTVRLSADADNVRYDAQSKRLYVGHGSGAISSIDPAAGRVLGEVPLPGHPESFQLEQGGSRMYANVPGAQIVAVIDREAMKVEAKWAIAGARANYPMALDQAGRRIFVGCRQPAKVLVYDTTSGRQTGDFAICGDTDDMFFDAVRKRLYVSCGEGFLDVFQQQDTGRFVRTVHLPTAPRARTSLYVAEENRFYLAVPSRGTQKAEVRVFSVRD